MADINDYTLELALTGRIPLDPPRLARRLAGDRPLSHPEPHPPVTSTACGAEAPAAPAPPRE